MVIIQRLSGHDHRPYPSGGDSRCESGVTTLTMYRKIRVL